MSRESLWSGLVLLFSAGAYAPLAIGGYHHPSEINTASYGLWCILSGMLLYSSRAQDYAGWYLPLGFFFGNASMLVLAAVVGGYTFNLGSAETTILYGIIGTLSIWLAGGATKEWNPRILFIGGVAADVLSFYPQMKQYLLPHDPPTAWMILGWSMWITGAVINVVFVERLFAKLRSATTTPAKLRAIEESAFSLENSVFMLATVYVMTLY